MNFVSSYFSLSSNSSGIEFVQDLNFQVGHSNEIQSYNYFRTVMSKKNSFVRFLRESVVRQSAFGFI